jgi:long-chain fatty acid transport protein
MRNKLLWIIIITLLMTSLCLATNGTRLIGFGTKMNGRGGTGIGVFDSPSLMMSNPAGIAFFDKASLGINIAALMPVTHFQNTLNDKEGEHNTFPLGGIGYIAKPLLQNRLSWGVGVFTLGGMGADYDLNHALFRDASGSYIPQKYHSKFALLQAGPCVAYHLTPDLAIGTTLHAVYGQLEFQMPYSMAPSIMKGVVNPQNGMTFGQMFAGAPLNYTEVTAASEMKDLEAWGFGAKLGFAWKVSPRLHLGLNYTAPTPLTYKNGKANMDMTAQFHDAFVKEVGAYVAAHGVTPDSASAAVGAQFASMGIDASKGMAAVYDLEAKLTNPQSLGFGAAYQFLPKVNLSMDLEWINWKDAYDKMDLNLTGGQNPNINRLLGNTGDFSVEFPMQWKNSILVRVGGEYAVAPTTILRAGYAFGSNPVPSSTLFSIFPAIVEHHLTVGASHNLSAALSVHAAFEYALNRKANADQVSLIAHEYDNSKDQLSGMLLNIGFAWDFQ